VFPKPYTTWRCFQSFDFILVTPKLEEDIFLAYTLEGVVVISIIMIGISLATSSNNNNITVATTADAILDIIFYASLQI